MRCKIKKNTYLLCFILTCLIAIGVLGTIWVIEEKYTVVPEHTYKVDLIGDYEIVWPEEGRQYGELEITGHFSEPIEKNKQVILRIDNLLVDLYVNDELVFSFGEEGSFPAFAKSPGNGWKYFISPGIAATDEIKIKLTNVYDNHPEAAFKGFFENIYTGYASEVILSSFRMLILNFFIAMLAISIGFLVIVISFQFAHMRELLERMSAFAAISITSGIWFVIDFRVQGYLINLPVFNNSIDILSMMIALAALLAYVGTFLRQNHKKCLLQLGMGMMGLTVVASIMQLAGVCDLYDWIPIIYVCCILAAGGILLFVLFERFVYKEKQLDVVVASLIVLVIGMAGDVIFLYLQISSTIFWIKISYIFFLVTQVVMLVRELQHIMRENIQVSLLKEMAYKDRLTGLNNRTAYELRIEKIKTNLASNSSLAVLVCDINGLKRVNDTQGHEEGDRLIIAAADLLKEVFGMAHTYRIGGDEFVVILEGKEYTKLDALLQLLKMKLCSQEMVQMAYGIATYSSDRQVSFEELFDGADKEMYKQKALVKRER